ncbi:hypothetical protein SAMN05216359_10248 [Roseateles sp. YR242]|uniref:hypothetical protein n=1 Tax=Roseateles sp. YR242 TaxID=1855305 RepID=UPI0008CA78E1|nr:hypothetical protein [Roseateles sp. YR242]SEK51548.1 hypothetical protein SAMN05216359_10248 [Roseateles sp. YR242]
MNSLQHKEALPLKPDEGAAVTMLELRVLTGLQAGAALPLDPPITVGRGDDCDMLLLDEQMPEVLLRIGLDAQGRPVLEPLEGGLTDEAGQPIQAAGVVGIGQAFGTGGVWLEVQPGHAPWTPWTDPADRPASDDTAVAGDGHAAGGALMGGEDASADGAVAVDGPPADVDADEADAELDFDDWIPDTPAGGDVVGLDDPWAVSPKGAAPLVPEIGRGAAGQAGTRALRGPVLQRTLVLVGGAAFTLFGLAAIALQLGLPAFGDAVASPPVRSSAPSPMNRPPAQAPQMVGEPVGMPTEDAPAAMDLVDPVAAATPALARRREAPASVAGVTLLRGATAITLPFEVREVVMGPRSRVVLGTGRVLVPGDAEGDWRLMEIKAGTLVFEGPERVLLPW